jgi:hypothetical protein
VKEAATWYENLFLMEGVVERSLTRAGSPSVGRGVVVVGARRVLIEKMESSSLVSSK